MISDREEALKEDYTGDGSTFDDDDDDWAGDDNTWTDDNEREEGDVKDESSAYLEFLDEEVSYRSRPLLFDFAESFQAQKFGNLEGTDGDEDLGEESLLETPLDRVEPYSMFKNALLSRSLSRPTNGLNANPIQSFNLSNLMFTPHSPLT